MKKFFSLPLFFTFNITLFCQNNKREAVKKCKKKKKENSIFKKILKIKKMRKNKITKITKFSNSDFIHLFSATEFAYPTKIM